jgi:preprotein translocase subunit YajC
MINIAKAEPVTNAIPSGVGFDYMNFLPIILIFGVFYFLIIRPQQKKMQQQKQMLSSIKPKDKVLTIGGIIGTVTNAKDEREIEVEISNGVKVMFSRNAVSEIINRNDQDYAKIKQDPETSAITNKKNKNLKPTTANKGNDPQGKANIKLVNEE